MSVLIIGAGVIGLSIARELHRRGFDEITIIERGLVGREASWAAAGMLAPGTETLATDDLYRLCATSNRLYTSFTEELLDETGVDIELNNDGTIFVALNEAESEALGARYDAQSRIGISVERMSASEAIRAEPNLSPNTAEALYYPDDRQVENRKLLDALELYARQHGISIVENVTVTGLAMNGDRVVGAATGSKIVLSDLTILATGAWTSLIKLGSERMPVAVKPIRGQMIAFEGLARLARRVICSSRGYLVPRRDGRLLAGATVEDVGFDDAITVDASSSLRIAAEEIIPGLKGQLVSDQWSGLRPYEDDALPVIGSISGIDGMILATAHYRNGILLAPITAQVVAEIAAGSPPDARVKAFSPDRFIPCVRSAAK